MGIVDRVLVLDFGRVIALGRPEETQANPNVIKAYLGEELSHDAHDAGAPGLAPASAQMSSSESGSHRR
jgi:hypothetical protein